MRSCLVLLLALCLAAPLPVQAHAPQALPLGDGKISHAPKRGYLFVCEVRPPGGGGAFRSGRWISGGVWRPGEKPVVEGDVAWPNAAITITTEGTQRVIRANSLPSHRTGEFPIRPGTAAYDYDRNPNRIAPRDILLTLPASPQPAAEPGCAPMGMIGFAISGVAIYNAIDLSGRDAPAHEIQDRCNGHPEISSQYHYHNWSPCLAGEDPEAPVGWMLDGYPILGPEDASGRVVTNADLDECHGRVGPVRLGGRVVTLYHYHFTYEFPYTIGCFHGAVSRSRTPELGAP